MKKSAGDIGGALDFLFTGTGLQDKEMQLGTFCFWCGDVATVTEYDTIECPACSYNSTSMHVRHRNSRYIADRLYRQWNRLSHYEQIDYGMYARRWEYDYLLSWSNRPVIFYSRRFL